MFKTTFPASTVSNPVGLGSLESSFWTTVMGHCFTRFVLHQL